MKNKNRLYTSPGDATKQLHEDYNDWSSGVSKYSIQLAYAVIAGNWAAHGTVNVILTNGFSRCSLILVFMFLALNLLGTYSIMFLIKKRIKYANDNPPPLETGA